MASLLFFLFVAWVVLAVGLTAWTYWFQNYAYTEVAEGTFWRAPLAGTILMLYLCIWCVLSYRAVRADPSAGNPYATTFALNPTREQRFAVLYTVTPRPQTLNIEGEEARPARNCYVRIKTGTGAEEYRKDGQVRGDLLPSRPDEIIVQEGPEEISFKPDRDANGHFKVEEINYLFTTTKRPLCYRDDRNRVMEEGSLGTITYSRTGQMWLNCALHLLHLVIWFVCMWLLLRFQVGHAVVIALVCWLAMTFCIVGPVFDRTEAAARAVPVVRNI